jgi:hypothetical protein
MITAEEKTRERFPNKNNRDNNWDNPKRRSYRGDRSQDRKRRSDNTVAMADKAKKFYKPRKYDNLENMPCIWHPADRHKTGDCSFFHDNYSRKEDNEAKKDEHQKKAKDNKEENEL